MATISCFAVERYLYRSFLSVSKHKTIESEKNNIIKCVPSVSSCFNSCF